MPGTPEICPPGGEKAEGCLNVFKVMELKVPQHETEGAEMAARATRKLERKAVIQLKAWSKGQASRGGLRWGGLPHPGLLSACLSGGKKIC